MKCLSREAERCCSQTKNWYSTEKEFRNDTLSDQAEERSETKWFNDVSKFSQGHGKTFGRHIREMAQCSVF